MLDIKVNIVARYIAATSLGIWIGGLTFYALVVVPVGTGVIGGTNQGLVTQQVTNYLNWIGAGSIVALLFSLQKRWMAGTWAVLAVTLAGLFALHPRLDSLLARQDGAFYDWHRAYLLVTAIQWLAGVAHLWGVVQSTSKTSPDAVT